MAACMAPPWPSQRRGGALSNSERHSALARMRERRAVRDAEQDCGKLPPKAPLSARTPRGGVVEQLPAVPLSARRERDDSSDTRDFDGNSSLTKPWSPAWTPESPRPRFADSAVDRKAATGERFVSSRGGSGTETPRGERPPRREVVAEEEFSGGGASRVRGPSEARAARRPQTSAGADAAGADDELPKGVKAADFKTLQEMIAKGIVESENGASKMEATLQAVTDDDDELRRHREAMRRRREEAEQARIRERELAKQKRQREWDEREKRLQAELESDEQKMLRAQQEQAAADAACQREFAAASRIQALVRGRRSRAGKTLESPSVRAVLHAVPWARSESAEDLD
eukprot:gb/GFBE01074847.1/.p1 GENE.gb/GFBE01074847.1/~~gb/GFBE01074847.1/.p1  ORF type:complete len:345 (+),score=63.88 gb/GFBE01074847.1/:1-1035(+)